MRKPGLLLTLHLLTIPICFSQERNTRLSVQQHPYYSRYIKTALKELLARRAAGGEGHFYIAKVEVVSEGSHYAWVYWEEKSVLILWEPNRGRNARGEVEPRLDLINSQHYVLLDKTLIPEFEDVTDSLFVVEREEAARQLEKCMQGIKFVINRKSTK